MSVVSKAEMFAKLKQKTIDDQRPKAQTPKQDSTTTDKNQGQARKVLNCSGLGRSTVGAH